MREIAGDEDRRGEGGRSFQATVSRFAVILNETGNYWRVECRHDIIFMT